MNKKNNTYFEDQDRLMKNLKLLYEAKEQYIRSNVDNIHNTVTDFIYTLYFAEVFTKYEENIASETSEKNVENIIKRYKDVPLTKLEAHIAHIEGMPCLESFESFKKRSMRHLKEMLTIILGNNEIAINDIKEYFKKSRYTRGFSYEDMEFITFLIETHSLNSAGDNGTLFRKEHFYELDDWYASYMFDGIKGFAMRHSEDFQFFTETLIDEWKIKLSVLNRELHNEIMFLNAIVNDSIMNESGDLKEQFYEYAKEQIEKCCNSLILKRNELMSEYAPKIDFDTLASTLLTNTANNVSK